LDGTGVFFEDPGVEGCLSDLFMESGVPIAFDSRSGVSFLTQVFWHVLVFSSTDWGLIGCGIWMSAEIWLSCGDERVKCCCRDEKVRCIYLGVLVGVIVFFGVTLVWVVVDRFLDFVSMVIHDGVWGFDSTFGLCWFVGI